MGVSRAHASAGALEEVVTVAHLVRIGALTGADGEFIREELVPGHRRLGGRTWPNQNPGLGAFQGNHRLVAQRVGPFGRNRDAEARLDVGKLGHAAPDQDFGRTAVNPPAGTSSAHRGLYYARAQFTPSGAASALGTRLPNPGLQPP